jgi:crooked neck
MESEESDEAEEGAGPSEAVREVYERAIANVPPAAHKRHWRRYIYLWINYALYEELRGGDENAERCRQVRGNHLL